ncbi:hypothetical protein CN326_05660 [Bacillus sp. AFS018417]|uniref:hypothetical protein n=1 Tax=Bacillus sp. AFS018417 TaxID=2033491 RepID=UPI000BF7B0AB|nr:MULTISPECIES: hypothetical protein [unclassified Bacillus (in: firmicutes)]MCP1124033.1 hypothetical protein [Bacillus sp. 3103sda1]PEZ08424.1 hypothetical protein CN326_05660 [Bacillus sp. AFS018417]
MSYHNNRNDSNGLKIQHKTSNFDAWKYESIYKYSPLFSYKKLFKTFFRIFSTNNKKLNS